MSRPRPPHTPRRRHARHGAAHLPGPARPHPIASVWRWRTELLLLAVAAALGLVVAGAVARRSWGGLVLLSIITAIPVASAEGRRWIAAHAWCLISRHRLQRVFAETPLHTRAGRLPLVLWITPVPLGERALILCRAGTSAEAFAEFAPEFESACAAIRVQVARHARHPQFVRIDIVRRPAGSRPLAPGLAALYGAEGDWVRVERGSRELDEPPDRTGALAA